MKICKESHPVEEVLQQIEYILERNSMKSHAGFCIAGFCIEYNNETYRLLDVDDNVMVIALPRSIDSERVTL